MKKNNIILLTAFMAAGVFLTSCDTEKVPSVETTAETTTAIVTTVSEKATEPTTLKYNLFSNVSLNVPVSTIRYETELRNKLGRKATKLSFA